MAEITALLIRVPKTIPRLIARAIKEAKTKWRIRKMRNDRWITKTIRATSKAKA
jgi:hypothetical protein